MNKETEINICCPLLKIVGCGNTEEHQHLICDAKSGLDEQGIIDNELVIKYCLGKYSLCPYLSKEVKKKILLTPAEHDTYLHICGRTGLELTEIVKEKPTYCSKCPQLEKCLATHSVPEWEGIKKGRVKSAAR